MYVASIGDFQRHTTTTLLVSKTDRVSKGVVGAIEIKVLALEGLSPHSFRREKRRRHTNEHPQKWEVVCVEEKERTIARIPL
jgi:hypothetical protein